MITLATPETDAERQRREAKARHHALWHDYCDLVYQHDTLKKALDEAARDEWQALHAYRAMARKHFSDYADQAARRDALRHWRILRRLLGVRGALRRVERRLARDRSKHEGRTVG